MSNRESTLLFKRRIFALMQETGHTHESVSSEMCEARLVLEFGQAFFDAHSYCIPQLTKEYLRAQKVKLSRFQKCVQGMKILSMQKGAVLQNDITISCEKYKQELEVEFGGEWFDEHAYLIPGIEDDIVKDKLNCVMRLTKREREQVRMSVQSPGIANCRKEDSHRDYILYAASFCIAQHLNQHYAASYTIARNVIFDVMQATCGVREVMSFPELVEIMQHTICSDDTTKQIWFNNVASNALIRIYVSATRTTFAGMRQEIRKGLSVPCMIDTPTDNESFLGHGVCAFENVDDRVVAINSVGLTYPSVLLCDNDAQNVNEFRVLEAYIFKVQIAQIFQSDTKTQALIPSIEKYYPPVLLRFQEPTAELEEMERFDKCVREFTQMAVDNNTHPNESTCKSMLLSKFGRDFMQKHAYRVHTLINKMESTIINGNAQSAHVSSIDAEPPVSKKLRIANLMHLPVPLPTDQGRHGNCATHCVSFCIARNLQFLYGDAYAIGRHKILHIMQSFCRKWNGTSFDEIAKCIQHTMCQEEEDKKFWFSNDWNDRRFRLAIDYTFIDFTRVHHEVRRGLAVPCAYERERFAGFHAVCAFEVDGHRLLAINSHGETNPIIPLCQHRSFEDGIYEVRHACLFSLQIMEVRTHDGIPMPIPLMNVIEEPLPLEVVVPRTMTQNEQCIQQ